MTAFPPDLLHAFTAEELSLAERRFNEHSQFLLITFVNTYLVLNEQEHSEWRERLIRKGDLDVDSDGQTWADHLVLIGLKEGLAEAAIELQEGTGLSLARKVSRDLGRMMGYARSAREIKEAVLRRQITTRFGQVPEELAAKLATADEKSIDRLLDSVVAASEVDELLSLMGEPEAERRRR
jgi:hypothetical protein